MSEELKHIENFSSGTSTAQFWTDISGAEFSHLESDCVQSMQAGLDSCVGYGGNIATILSRKMLDELQAAFSAQVFFIGHTYPYYVLVIIRLDVTKTCYLSFNVLKVTQAMWIGLNDVESEGTLVWQNGEPYLFTSWDESGSRNEETIDCVVMTVDFRYQNKTCSHTGISGYLCMKGTLSLPQYTFEATLGSNRRFQNEYTKEIMWDNVNKDFSGEKVAMNNNHILSYTMISMLFQCCDQCGLGFANTGLVSYSARQCWCGEFNGRHDIKLKV